MIKPLRIAALTIAVVATTFNAAMAKSSRMAFPPPSRGTKNDWILVIENAATSFPVPGTLNK